MVDTAKRVKALFLIDGEAVVSDGSGIADFERLRSRNYDASATLWAFNLFELTATARLG